MGDGVLAAADANMRAFWRSQVGLMPASGVVERNGAVFVSCGLPVPLFNPAFVTRAPDDPEALVQSAIDHYRSIDSPFLLYFRDEYDGGLADVCAAAGLIEHFRPPLMVMDPITAAPPLPHGCDVVVVDDSNVASCRRVLAQGFGMPEPLVDAAFPAAVTATGGFTAFLAFVDGEPASTAACFGSDDLVGIYNVATVPAHRGRGLGAAVTWAAVEAGAAASGATASILQASGAGAPVYQRMGFVTRDTYRQFEGAS